MYNQTQKEYMPDKTNTKRETPTTIIYIHNSGLEELEIPIKIGTLEQKTQD